MKTRNRSLHQPVLDPIERRAEQAIQGVWFDRERRAAIGRAEKAKADKDAAGSGQVSDSRRGTRSGSWW